MFTVVDRNMFDLFAAMCRSLVHVMPDHPELLVVHPDLSEGQLAWIERTLGSRVRFLAPRVDARWSTGLPSLISPLVFERMRLFGEEFSDYGNILHLDVDTLLLRDPRHLFAGDDLLVADNRGEMFGDYGSPFVRGFYEDGFKLLPLLDEDGIALSHRMVNAGVILIPPRYRRREVLDELWYLRERYARYLQYADQSLLTLWLAKNGIEPKLDIRWNFHPPHFLIPVLGVPASEIGILHFAGRAKPGSREFMEWALIAEHRPWLLEQCLRFAADRDGGAPARTAGGAFFP